MVLLKMYAVRRGLVIFMFSLWKIDTKLAPSEQGIRLPQISLYQQSVVPQEIKGCYPLNGCISLHLALIVFTCHMHTGLGVCRCKKPNIFVSLLDLQKILETNHVLFSCHFASQECQLQLQTCFYSAIHCLFSTFIIIMVK